MRANRVKAALQRGECVCGAFLTMIWSPGLVELIGGAGFDLVVLDDQHGWMNPETTAELIRTAENVGLTPLVRAPEIHPPTVAKFLDMGAQGIIFPGVASAEDARRAVASTRFEPEGTRSSCPSTRITGYTLDDWPTVYEQSKREILTILLVETRAGFDNLEAILAVEGIDVVLPGHFDLASSLGVAGQVDHPEVVQRVTRAKQLIRQRGITLCGWSLDEEALHRAAREGARMLWTSGTKLIADAFSGSAAAMRRAGEVSAAT